jgi:hypothetical protein
MNHLWCHVVVAGRVVMHNVMDTYLQDVTFAVSSINKGKNLSCQESKINIVVYTLQGIK